MLNRIQRLIQSYQQFMINKQYLRCGKYILLDDLRTFVEINESMETVKQYIYVPPTRHRLLMRILARFPMKVTRTSDFNGSVLYISNKMNISNSRIKIFNFSSGRIRNRYANDQECKSALLVYREVCGKLPIPSVCGEESSVVYDEELVRGFSLAVSSQIGKITVYNKLILSYTNFYKDKEQNKKFGNRSMESIKPVEADEYPEYPKVMQHNDLSIYNVLVDKQDNCNIIDWEHAGENYFFYDLMFLMLNDAERNQDASLLGSFLSGDFDEAFRMLFEAIGLIYEPERREQYLYVVYETMSLRLQNGQDEIKRISTLFCSLVKEVKLQRSK